MERIRQEHAGRDARPNTKSRSGCIVRQAHAGSDARADTKSSSGCIFRQAHAGRDTKGSSATTANSGAATYTNHGASGGDSSSHQPPVRHG